MKSQRITRISCPTRFKAGLKTLQHLLTEATRCLIVLYVLSMRLQPLCLVTQRCVKRPVSFFPLRSAGLQITEEWTGLMIVFLSAQRRLLFIDLLGFYYPIVEDSTGPANVSAFCNAEIIENIKKWKGFWATVNEYKSARRPPVCLAWRRVNCKHVTCSDVTTTTWRRDKESHTIRRTSAATLDEFSPQISEC